MQRKVSVLWGEKKVVLRETRRAVTPFGGLSVFIEFLKRIGFPERISRDVPVCLRSNNAIPAGQTFTAFLIAVCVESSTAVWEKPTQRVQPRRRTGRGRPRRPYYRGQPMALRKRASALPPEAWHQVTWRQGTQGPQRSRFAACRVQPATLSRCTVEKKKYRPERKGRRSRDIGHE